MTPPSSILTNDHDRASATAWGTLSVLVAVQVGIILWVVSSSIDETTPSAAQVTAAPLLPASNVRRQVPEVGQLTSPADAAPAVSTNAPPLVGTFGKSTPPPSLAPPPYATPTSLAPPPMMPGSSVPPPDERPVLPGSAARAPDDKPLMPGSGVSAPDEKPALPGGVTPPSAAVEARRDVNGLVTTAKELRALGNTQEALQSLQQADLVSPNHPAVLAEMAEVYEQMGLTTKSVDAWRSIQLQGAAKAGQYFELAQRRLGVVPGAATTVPSVLGTSADLDKRLRLGACQVARDFNVKDGERYVLRVPIQRAGSKSIDPNAIDMKTFFYYRVNGQVVLDNSTELAETWQTDPVDWSSSSDEIVDVTYALPSASPADIQQRSQKTYHGYMLHLYYDNKLQDVAAEPRDLLDVGMLARGQSAGGSNPLLPPIRR